MSLKIWVTTPFFYPDMSRPWTDLLNDMLSIVDAAEDLGFEGVMINENQFQNYVTNPSSLAFSAAAATRTKRLKIMPGVVVLPNYHPLLVASEMALLDHLAPGRMSIGVARGGSRYQLDRLGINPAEARDIYEEALEIIRRAWVEDDLTYDGKYFSFPETTIVPKPVTQPSPDLWVASQSVDGVKRVAEQGLNLLTAPNHGNFEPYGDLEELVQTFNDAAAASGKPRGEVMALRHTWLGRTEDEAQEYFGDILNEYNHYKALVKGSGKTQTKEGRLAARGVGDRVDDYIRAGRVYPESEAISRDGLYEKYADPILTTPDRMIERFKAYEEIGVDHIVCLVAMGQPNEAVLENLKFMAKEVLPAFA
ncbi:LLM class flavin-dependent oxidoreductase [Gordonia sp. zg691]|uniref:LLM class flavin-dependent oxidoreductase n=2 Tax=Gordonia jinghuaiqii TaxID=2758710 RepID=A0A7D7LWW4_9ACTN|nr:LLM class flavin-dependent oxidoreductase [Gordonia jinghuaiqii]MCR5978953.1 LLM class flavin-dependent oxidoreductase [Gordonia jinghuaiqii]QMT03661.1 LLM class flavin-dependent oxidoreductase [Gordonia jinghuaiqii]